MAKRKSKLKPTVETPAEAEVVLLVAPAVAVPTQSHERESVSTSAPVETLSSTAPATDAVAEASPPPAERPTSSSSHADRVSPGPTIANPFPFREDVEAGVRLAEDRRFKQMQIAFREKPSEAVRFEIGDAGYRWQSKERVWVKQLDPQQAWQTRAEADALFETVSAMIREEMGLGQHR